MTRNLQIGRVTGAIHREIYCWTEFGSVKVILTINRLRATYDTTRKIYRKPFGQMECSHSASTGDRAFYGQSGTG